MHTGGQVNDLPDPIERSRPVGVDSDVADFNFLLSNQLRPERSHSPAGWQAILD